MKIIALWLLIPFFCYSCEDVTNANVQKIRSWSTPLSNHSSAWHESHHIHLKDGRLCCLQIIRRNNQNTYSGSFSHGQQITPEQVQFLITCARKWTSTQYDWNSAIPLD